MKIKLDVRKPLTTKIKVKIRGGVDVWFDVKYERPPLVCYFYGKLGYGVKDCVDCLDCLDVENPQLNYGRWIKASPWRKLSSQEDRKDEQVARTCARSFFTAKPKPKDDVEAIKQVEDVLGKLNVCIIEDTIVGSVNTNIDIYTSMQHDMHTHSGDQSDATLCENKHSDGEKNDLIGFIGVGGLERWRRV